MKDNRLTVDINRTVSDVFNFTIDPKNTPKWIEASEKEETSEWPVKVGTVYTNTGKSGQAFEFKMTDIVPNKSFELIGSDNNYHCRYTFRDLGDNKTEFEYYEWMEDGELEAPFTQDVLGKLKSVMEST